MRLVHDVKGVSKLILIILLLVSFVVGALVSYVWTMGFYASQEFNLPKGGSVSIEGVSFSAQDTSYFEVTVLNPSYSTSTVKLTKITARTIDDNRLHEVNNSVPPLPYTLERGQSVTLKCDWSWASYTGIGFPYASTWVHIVVDIEDGSGATFTIKEPVVSFSISEVTFNSAIAYNHFNITVQNQQTSETYVNITSISVNVTSITADMITPAVPYGLAPGDAPAVFKVAWNWLDYRNQTVTVGVHTRQGYVDYRTITLPT
jgi:hypothetical protein